MSVVVSLLRAIDRADGEALVMHVGEKPYVVTATGHAELAANALTVPAMTGMLDQLLPADSRQALNELGAVEYHLPPDQSAPGTRYSVVAARGGDDIWIEVRRRKETEPAAPVAARQDTAVLAAETASRTQEPPAPVHTYEPRAPMQAHAPMPVREPDVVRFDEEEPPVTEEPERTVPYDLQPAAAEPTEPTAMEEPAPDVDVPEPAPAFEERAEDVAPSAEQDLAPAEPAPVDAPGVLEDSADGFELSTQTHEDFYADRTVEEDLHDEPRDARDAAAPAFDFTGAPEPAPLAVPVAPVSRLRVRFEAHQSPPAPSMPAASSGPPADPLHHLLKVAAAQGASALYVAPRARPSLRVDGEMRVLDDAPMTDAQLEAELRALVAPAGDAAALPLGDFETRELAGVGRVQCLLFRDHRGLGAIFRMLPGRTVSAEQAGLSAGIQSLCTEPEGLLLVTGALGAGKSTLVAALVDQVNRTRRDHVITVENDIQFVHENHTSFISQREARQDDLFLEAVRSAIREAPDVLVIDGVMNPDVAAVALQAAANGLVIASVTAPATSAALERFVGLAGGDAANASAAVGEHLRGVITQALLRKTGGGRAAAREVLVNVPSVASLVASGQFDQLQGVLNSGRRVGMVPLNDALLGLVQGGALDVRQAFRKSPDPRELLGMLNHAGFDTSFAENLS